MEIFFNQFENHSENCREENKTHREQIVHPKTGTSSNKSLIVPPPTEVTKAMRITPKGSNRFCIAAKLPDIAKAIVPKISIKKVKFGHMD